MDALSNLGMEHLSRQPDQPPSNAIYLRSTVVIVFL